MDPARFDDLVKSLSAALSRRRLLSGSAGVAAGLVVPRLAGSQAVCPPDQVLVAGRRCRCRSTGRPPIAGRCPCGSGERDCGDRCGPAGGCCVDTDCPATQFCQEDQCVDVCPPGPCECTVAVGLGTCVPLVDRTPDCYCFIFDPLCGVPCDSHDDCPPPVPSAYVDCAYAEECGGTFVCAFIY